MGLFDDFMGAGAQPDDQLSAPDPFAQVASAMQQAPEATAPPPQAADMGQLAALLNPPAPLPVAAPLPSQFVPQAPPPVPPPTPAALPVVPAYKGPQGTPTRKDVIGQAEGGVALEGQGIDASAQAQAAKTDYLADQKLQALKDAQAHSDALIQARQAIADKFQAKSDAFDSELKRVQTEHEGHSYFKDQGTAKTVLTLIGLGLGGYASRNGGPNVPLDLLQKQIEQYATKQARDYQEKVQNIGERRGIAKETMAGSLGAFEFKAAQQVEANNRVMSMIDAEASSFDDPITKAKAMEMKGQLAQKNAGLMEEVRAHQVSEAHSSAALGLQAQGLQLQKDQFKEQQRQFDITSLREIAKAEQDGDSKKAAQLKDQRERSVFSIKDPATGDVITAPRPEVATELNKKIGAADEAYNAVDKIFELRGAMGKDEPIVGGPNERRINEEMGNLKTAISKLTEQGVITTGDAKRLEQELGNPTSLFRNPDQLKQLQGTIVDKVNSSVRAETGVAKATWHSDADPEYARSVRPKSWTSSLAPLPEVPAGVASRPGRTPTKEEYQQQRAGQHQMLVEGLKQPVPGMTGSGAFTAPEPDFGAPSSVVPNTAGLGHLAEDPMDLVARLARQGGLYGR